MIARPRSGRAPLSACAVLSTVLATVLLSGCGGGSDTATAPSTQPSLSTATAASAPSSSPSTSASSASPTAGSAAVETVAPLTEGALVHVEGDTATLTHDIALPSFTGSGAAVAEVNRRVTASATSAVEASKAQDADGDASHHTLEGEGSVSTNDGRTVQVIIPMSDYYDGAAHPSDVVNTVVLVAATGAPVTLDELFTDQTAALTAFGEVVTEQADAEGSGISAPEGLEPTTANWAAWQSTEDGIAFQFQDYQLGGHGLRSYVVPWSDAEPHLTPYAKALLAPTG